MVLIGAPGAGKSSVLDALCTRLEVDDIGFGAIEVEHVLRGWPWIDFDEELAVLGDLIALQREHRRAAFLVVATPETDDELQAVIDAIGADRTLVVCLTAPAELVSARVADREPDEWPGKAQLVEHSRTLAEQVPVLERIDVRISTIGKEARDVAAELEQVLLDRGIVELTTPST
jgi:adenylate kinase family enzyme